MLFFVHEDIIEEKIKALYRHHHSELLDITRSLLQTHKALYWSSLKRVDRQEHYIQCFKLTPLTYSTVTVSLDTLHRIAPITWLKHIGSVEARRQFLTEFIPYFNQHYRGRLINPADTLLYGMEKRYLLTLQQRGFPVVQSTLYPNTVSHVDLVERYKKPSTVIIKPSTGKVPNSFSLLSNIDEQWLRYKENLVGGWIVQPFYQAIWDGEYQLVYFDDNLSHGVVKQYQKSKQGIPHKNNLSLAPYLPSQREINMGLDIKDFFQNSLNIKLDYFRMDFLKDNNDYRIVEVDMVNPCFFYDDLPQQLQKRIQQQATRFFNHSLTPASF